MGIFRQFPYSNFHELNMDWLLSKVDEWGKMVDELEIEFKTLDAKFNDLKKYVQNFFDDVVIQQAISNKLDEMLANGELQQILQNIKCVTWDALHTMDLKGKAEYRIRHDYFADPTIAGDENSNPHCSYQNGIVYATDGDYSENGQNRYLYTWYVWQNGVHTDLVTINLTTHAETGRLRCENARHGGSFAIKDGYLYSIAGGYVWQFDLAGAHAPQKVGTEQPVNITPKNLVGYNPAGYWMVANDKDDNLDKKRRLYRVDDSFSTATEMYILGTSNDIVSQDYSFDPDRKVIYQAQTWPNIISMIDVSNGKVIQDYFIPDDICYINTGEIEYVDAHGDDIYFGGISTAGCPGSQQLELTAFHTNPHIQNQSRHINNRVEGYHTVYLNINYSGNELGLNNTFAGGTGNLASGNIVFRYVEDCMNYVKSHSGGIVSFSSDYDYSFHVPVNCRINFNGHYIRAWKLDNNVEAIVSGLGTINQFSGVPIWYNYTRGVGSGGADVTRKTTCYIYVEYGSTLKAIDLSNLSYNSNADVMIWVNYGRLELLTGHSTVAAGDLTHILATNSIVEGSCVLSDYIYSRHSFWDVRGININKVEHMYFDNDSTIHSNVWRNTSTRTSLNDILGKKLPRETNVEIMTGSGVGNRPITPIQVFSYTANSPRNFTWGHWNSDGSSYVTVNFTIDHVADTGSDYTPIGLIKRHYWILTTSDNVGDVGDFSAIGTMNN